MPGHSHAVDRESVSEFVHGGTFPVLAGELVHFIIV
jgi:hypothetical protein